MKCQLATVMFPVLAMVVVAATSPAAELTATLSDSGVVVKIDGEPFATYVPEFNGTPVIWPIIGPSGKSMTRSYPMGKAPNEKEDHVHHRSMWFTHGDVNGLSYWHRETIKHREFVKIEGGKRALIVTRNDWLTPEGKKVCEDERTLRFGSDGDARWIDFDVVIKASNGPVRFGDTKEGTMAVRVAETMKVDAEKGGRIVNSEGQMDKAAWGKPAAWVDYQGPVDGENLGIAILNHPSSFRFPTYWHVRTYGLFAANPFGLDNFISGRDVDGSHTLADGETMKLYYRVVLHRGDEKTAKLAEAFAAYAKEKK